MKNFDSEKIKIFEKNPGDIKICDTFIKRNSAIICLDKSKFSEQQDITEFTSALLSVYPTTSRSFTIPVVEYDTYFSLIALPLKGELFYDGKQCQIGFDSEAIGNFDRQKLKYKMKEGSPVDEGDIDSFKILKKFKKSKPKEEAASPTTEGDNQV